MAKGDQTRLLKTSTEYKGSTTTVTLDTDLQTTLVANESYLIEGFLHTSVPTPIRLNFKAPGGSTGWYAMYQAQVDVTDTGTNPLVIEIAGNTLDTEATATASSLWFYSYITGLITTGGSPSLGGTFGLRWAQVSSSGSPGGNPTDLNEGSWLILTQVGSPVSEAN